LQCKSGAENDSFPVNMANGAEKIKEKFAQKRKTKKILFKGQKI
jgi:hypothetical protein